MKLNLISNILLIILLSSVYSNNLKKEPVTTETPTNPPEYKTFLIKTDLSKEELKKLIQDEEKRLIHVDKNKTHKNKTTVKQLTYNSTNLNDSTLQKKIEKEIKKEGLAHVNEPHVHKNETTILVTKTNTRFIDSLYEKKFSKIYAYLTLFLFVFVMIYYKESLFNSKNMKMKNSYKDAFGYYNEKEYMLVKNN